jgi:hypothetical protein
MMTLHISKIMQTCLRPRAKARLSVVIAMMLSCVLHAQVTTVPFFASPNDSIIVQFDASEGNGALKSITGDIYAHTGIITALSTSPTDWKYVKAQWTENTAACKLKRVNGTRYELAIGRPHTFYNVPRVPTSSCSLRHPSNVLSTQVLSFACLPPHRPELRCCSWQ